MLFINFITMEFEVVIDAPKLLRKGVGWLVLNDRWATQEGLVGKMSIPTRETGMSHLCPRIFGLLNSSHLQVPTFKTSITAAVWMPSTCQYEYQLSQSRGRCARSLARA